MTTFYLEPANLEKWIHQNEGIYTGMFVDGCLLDNFVLGCKRGFAIFYESVVNCWTSRYKVVFVPYKTGHRPEYDKAFSDWFAFADEAEREGKA